MSMEWRCFRCGAPLTRKKCDYCGARNSKSRKVDSSESTLVEEKAPEVPTKSELSKASTKSEMPKASRGGCSDGCASGCSDGCVSGCSEGCVSGCGEGCLRLIGQVLSEAIGSLFDGC